jgi:polyhydroxyalkanoate synthesis regulator phasin
VRVRIWLSGLCLGLLLVGGVRAAAEREAPAFGTLEATSPAAAKAQAEAWLKQVGKTDADTMQKFQAIWAQDTRPVLDRLADTFALGDARAAKLMAEARNQTAPAPTEVPEVLKDEKLPLFFRANLGLAYARALSLRHVNDEAGEILQLYRPEQVVAPATFLFTRAVCEHATLNKEQATKSIARLLEEGVASPERYRTVGMLMLLDMQTWQAKDLAAVSRKMNVISDRLDIARGGPRTQKLQKEVVARLDELIKELENKAKGGGGGGGGSCPNGGACPSGGQQPGSSPGANPTSPMKDTNLTNGQGGTGNVDPKQFKKVMERWGSLPAREQARAIQDLTRGMSPRHREAIENYFRNLARGNRP